MLHQIGAGALGPVFRAYEPEPGRLVAVKLFRLDLPPERAHQLVAELERLVAADLSHPGIAAPIAAGLSEVTPYLAQDFVTADSLDVVIRTGGSLAPGEVTRVAALVGAALDFAADRDVLHGALHPRDIMLSADDVRITGLGIARALEQVHINTPIRRPYSPPERAVGGPWDARADLFSFAALMFELLYGRRVSGTGDRAVAAVPEIPGTSRMALKRVFARGLSADPGGRFASGVAFADALRDALARLEESSAPPLPMALEMDEQAPGAPEGPSSNESAATPRKSARKRVKSAGDVRLTTDDLEPTTKNPLSLPLDAGSLDLQELFDGQAAPQRSSSDFDLRTEDLDVPEPSATPTAADQAIVDEFPIEELAAMERAFRADLGDALTTPLRHPDEPLFEAHFASASGGDHSLPGGLAELPVDDVAAHLDLHLSHQAEAHDDGGIELRAREQSHDAADHDEITTRSADVDDEPAREERGRDIEGPTLTLTSQVLETSRSAIWPIPVALVVGAAIGFGIAMPLVSRNQSAQVERAVTEAAMSRPEPMALSEPPILSEPVAPSPSAASGSGAVTGTAIAPRPESTSGTPANSPSVAPPAPAPRPERPRVVSGRVVIRSTPSGARVVVDGKNAGVTPLTVADLAVGAHNIRVTREGYVASERRISISQERPSATMAIDLDRVPAPRPSTPPRAAAKAPVSAPAPAAPAATTGTLIVDSRPGRAIVLLDGRAVGTTPLTLNNISAAEHAVTIDLPGFRRWATSVKVAGGQQTRVGASLEQQ